MKNPYEIQSPEDKIRIGPIGKRVAILAFFLLVLVPGLSLFEPRPGPLHSLPPATASNWLEWRDRIDDLAKGLPLFERWRRTDQSALGRSAGTGNRRVFSGREGWLYYRSDLDAVFGKGPHHAEPASVARERVEKTWRPPLPEIRAFASELRRRGIELLVVPVPTKPMLCREGLGLPPATSPHPQLASTLRELGESGIAVIDLSDLFLRHGMAEDRFLRQDTHWTPSLMEATARMVAERVATLAAAGPAVATRIVEVERESAGDLVGMFGLGEGQTLFGPESALLRRVVDAASGETLESDPGSEVAVLGDSFVNIFDDPSLGFASEGEKTIGAGFSSHLAAALGATVHTIAINGGGATAVREAFAGLTPEQIGAKKVVVWVLSSRDLLLPEVPARRAGIEWRAVEFRPAESRQPSSGSEVPNASREIVATLREKSMIEDPAQTPYPSAVFSAVFDTEEGGEAYVFLWAFRERKLGPDALIEPGRRYRLRLVPLEKEPAAARATRLDDFFRADLAPYFAESLEGIE